MPVFRSWNNRLVFFAHTPKTGGTYVENLFKANRYEECLSFSKPWRFGMKISPQHYHREIYEKIIDFDRIDFSFMTVRHPYDRFMSELRYQLLKHKSDVCDLVRAAEDRFKNNPCALDNHLRPQIDFFHPNLKIFKIETGLGKSWAQEVSRRFQLGFNIFEVNIPLVTSSNKIVMTPESVKAVKSFCQRYYKNDFLFFDYKIDMDLK